MAAAIVGVLSSMALRVECANDRSAICYAVRSTSLRLRSIVLNRAALRRLLTATNGLVKIEYLKRDLLRTSVHPKPPASSDSELSAEHGRAAVSAALVLAAAGQERQLRTGRSLSDDGPQQQNDDIDDRRRHQDAQRDHQNRRRNVDARDDEIPTTDRDHAGVARPEHRLHGRQSLIGSKMKPRWGWRHN